MKKIEINGTNYEIVRNDNDCFNMEEISEKLTDYFDDYDYIFGDYAYEKVRLKGYYDSNNKKVKKINDIKYMDDYIENYCSFGAKIFLLKKIK
ncbi:MAG: YutD family protein [Bacilli bacterium]|nr:YutD family protein [Bacilli bacterium]